MKFDIRNQLDNTADIYFYGDILSNDSEAWGYDDVVPSDVIKQLAELKGKDLNIHISSYGGSVFGGMAIYSSLMAIENKKTVYIDSIGASIASVIAMAGDKIVMPNNSMLMIHPAFCSCMANASEMRKQAEILEKIDAQILDIYKTRLRDDYDIENLKKLISEESWLTARECAEIFNNIEIVEEKVVAFAKATESNFLNNYKNIPSELLNELEEEEKEDEKEEEKQVCEKCGKEECECEEVVEEEQVEVQEEKEEEVEEEEEIKDEEKEEEQIEEQEDEEQVEEEVCPDCQKNPCECEEIKKQQEEQRKIVQIAQAKKELSFLEARAFLKKYL